MKKFKLYPETLALLEKLNPATNEYERLAKEIGACARWIRKVRNGEIKDPSVIRIQKLYDCLAKKK